MAHLPNLKELPFGGVNVSITGVDVDALRAAVAASETAHRRVLALLEAVVAHPPEPPAGATRIEPSVRVRPELEARLIRLEAQIQAIQARRRDDS